MRARQWSIWFVAAGLMASGAWAQSPRGFPADMAVIDAGTKCYALPGPKPGETRPVCVWRTPAAPPGELPVIYVTDGAVALLVFLLDLQTAVRTGAVKPFVMVSIGARGAQDERSQEYIFGWRGGQADFAAHERWLVDQVLPWAQQTHAASADPAQRFIGGFSNGADFALAMAWRHPDKFGGALVMSPYAAKSGWVTDTARRQRWVVAGGTEEGTGGGKLPRELARKLVKRGAAVRTCIGRWKHEGRIWRQLAPGSIVWLMALGEPDKVQTPLEAEHCK